MPYEPNNPCQGNPANPDEAVTLFPPGSHPEDRADKLSALCSYGISPLVLTGAFRQILIQVFADPRNILNHTLRTRLTQTGGWQPNNKPGIMIEALTSWNPQMAEHRLAIIIKSHEWTWQRRGIGDQAGVDYRTGRAFFAGEWTGAHTFFVLGNEGEETLQLAIETGKQLRWFGALIMQQLELSRFVVVSIGEIAALKESSEHYVVPVTVAYAGWEGWYTQPEAPRLKHIEFTTEEALKGY